MLIHFAKSTNLTELFQSTNSFHIRSHCTTLKIDQACHSDDITLLVGLLFFLSYIVSKCEKTNHRHQVLYIHTTVVKVYCSNKIYKK